TEPRFLGRHLAAGFDAYTYRYNFSQQASYDTASTGAGVRLGFPLTPSIYMTTRYTLRVDDVIVSDSLCVPGAQLVSIVLCQQRGSYITSLAGYSLRLDRRNDPILATRGYYIDISQDIAGFGGAVHYVRTQVDGGWYHGFNKDFILSVTGRSGYVEG